MQTLTLDGYLAASPSILSAKDSGRKRAAFRVLETTRFRRADGSAGERTTGFNCVCFNETTTEKYLVPFAHKGTRVVIQGHVENDSWTGKDGVEHYDLRLIVSDIRLKNRRDANEDKRTLGQSATLNAPAPAFGVEDDIPF